MLVFLCVFLFYLSHCVLLRNGVGFFIRCNTDVADEWDQCYIFCIYIVYICVWVYWGDGNKFMYVYITDILSTLTEYLATYMYIHAYIHTYIHL